MKLLKSLFTITLLLLIVSCGKDESDSQPSGIKKNDNKNSTSIYPEASRMEMPKLKGGQSILLVADGAVLQRDRANDIVDLGGGDGDMKQECKITVIDKNYRLPDVG